MHVEIENCGQGGIFCDCGGFEKSRLRKVFRVQQKRGEAIYLLLVYLVTALVPSEMACLESSPGR